MSEKKNFAYSLFFYKLFILLIYTECLNSVLVFLLGWNMKVDWIKTKRNSYIYYFEKFATVIKKLTKWYQWIKREWRKR